MSDFVDSSLTGQRALLDTPEVVSLSQSIQRKSQKQVSERMVQSQTRESCNTRSQLKQKQKYKEEAESKMLITGAPIQIDLQQQKSQEQHIEEEKQEQQQQQKSREDEEEEMNAENNIDEGNQQKEDDQDDFVFNFNDDDEIKDFRMKQHQGQESIESDQNCETAQKIKKIIIMLVKCVDKSDDKLYLEREKSVGRDRDIGEIFDLLVKKFRKLKKTKEEMTKYCMRKAFKFLAEKHRKILEGRDTTDFLKQYFEHMESESFSVPFKKNSEEKTMNTNFLKKVFSSKQFVTDYKQFLAAFRMVVEEDNVKKVKYLTSTIKMHLTSGTIKKLQTVKRLPWTQAILDKTIDLANKLLTHSPFGNLIDEEEQDKDVKVPTIKKSQSNGKSKNSKNDVNSSQPVVVLRKKVIAPIYPPLSLSPPKILLKAFVKVDYEFQL